jgi:hypothetical protein
VKSLASSAIDEIFGSDLSIMAALKDPDPVIRKYAVEILAAKETSSVGTTSGSSNNKQNGGQYILVLKILLGMLHDPDADVKKAAEVAINAYIGLLQTSPGQGGGGGMGAAGPMTFH